MASNPRFDSWVIQLAVVDLYEQQGFESTREGARHLGVNRTTLDRILTGKIQMHDPARIHGIAGRLGASPTLSNQLFRLALQTHDNNASGFHSPSWHLGGFEGPPFRILEAAADRLDILELTMVTGLLQTPAYVEAQKISDPLSTEADVPAVKDYKRIRQEKRFGEEGKGGSEIRVVMTEQCLLGIKDEDYYEDQIEHMLELVERQGIGIYILPMGHESNRLLVRPFTIMGFDDPGPWEFVFMESYLGSEWAESETAIEKFRGLFSLVLKGCTELGVYVGC